MKSAPPYKLYSRMKPVEVSILPVESQCGDARIRNSTGHGVPARGVYRADFEQPPAAAAAQLSV